MTFILTLYHLPATGAPIDGMAPAGYEHPPAHFWNIKYPGDGALSMEATIPYDTPAVPACPLFLKIICASAPGKAVDAPIIKSATIIPSQNWSESSAVPSSKSSPGYRVAEPVMYLLPVPQGSSTVHVPYSPDSARDFQPGGAEPPEYTPDASSKGSNARSS
jgi:hypothetical protein